MAFIAFGLKSYGQGVPELLYYTFNQSGTSVSNFASSPVGTNPASITGTGLTQGSTGLTGSALVGTGVTSSTGIINTGWSTSFPGSFTIAFWTSSITTGTSTLYYIWGDGGAGGFRCFTNGVAGANNWIVRGGNLPDLDIPGGATSAPNMIHIVRDTATHTYKSYLNGVLKDSVYSTNSFSTSGTGFTIGGYTTSYNLSGKMDEFRIYNRALSVSEINATYNQSLPMGFDVGATYIVSGDTLCNNSQPVIVRVKNFGVDTIDSLRINWSVNNVIQPVKYFNGTIISGDTFHVNVGNFNFQPGNQYVIKAYTSHPNGNADMDLTNDSTSRTFLSVITGPTFTPNTSYYPVCTGDSIVLEGSLMGVAPWSMIISDGSLDSTFSNITNTSFGWQLLPDSTTTYTVIEVVDASGCIYYSTSSILVDLLPKPPAQITTTYDTIFCIGDSAVLVANSGIGLSYSWFESYNLLVDTSISYTAQNSGLYGVVVVDTNGCKGFSNTIQIIANSLPNIYLGADTNIAMKDSIVLDAGAGFTSYLWSTGETTQTIEADTTGYGLGLETFWVMVTDVGGCTGYDSINITFTTNPGFNGINNSGGILIYPNPARDRLNLYLPRSLNVEKLLVVDLNGKEIEESEISSSQISLDISYLSPGVYFIKFISSEKSSFIKFVVE